MPSGGSHSQRKISPLAPVEGSEPHGTQHHASTVEASTQ